MRQQTTPQAFLSRTFFPWNYTLILLFFFPRHHPSTLRTRPFLLYFFLLLLPFLYFLFTSTLHSPSLSAPPLSLTSSSPPRNTRRWPFFDSAEPRRHTLFTCLDETLPPVNTGRTRRGWRVFNFESKWNSTGRIYTRNTERGCKIRRGEVLLPLRV